MSYILFETYPTEMRAKSDESPYFSHYPSKIRHAADAADVDFKSYTRKCSESSEIVVTTIITIYELSLRFRL